MVVVRINDEIEEYVAKSKYDDTTKKFLKEALILEYKRNEKDKKHYTKDYDRLVKKFI